MDHFEKETSVRAMGLSPSHALKAVSTESTPVCEQMGKELIASLQGAEHRDQRASDRQRAHRYVASSDSPTASTTVIHYIGAAHRTSSSLHRSSLPDSTGGRPTLSE